MRDWDLSVACQPCRFGIDHGNGEPIAAVYDRYAFDSAPTTPRTMTFALSNRCNLGCIMCTPALSSRLRSEAGMAPLPSPYDDRFFEELEPFLPELEVAKFLGGEPFLVADHRRVWETMDRVGASPKLEVTTNGTVWTPMVDWVTERFRVDISVSVDAMTASTYEAIRRGGEFTELCTNLDRFAERCRDRGTNLHLSFCLMVQNWRELAPFLVWAEQYTFGPAVTVSNVATRGMSVLDLPTPRLEEIRETWRLDHQRLAGAMNRNRSVWDDQRALLDAVLAERSSGLDTRAPRPQPVPPDPFSSIDASSGSTVVPSSAVDRQVEEQRRGLRSWSQSGAVGELAVDRQGTVTRVVTGHERLGLRPTSMEARPLDDLVDVMAEADGRTIWTIDVDVRPETVVRSFVLTASDPVRGTPGASVRTVQVFHPDGSTVLVAEDDIFDRATNRSVPDASGVAVELSGTSRSG